MNERRSSYRLHAGTASILLVFLTLCLVSFAVLTASNASADLKLSQKYAERTAAYYAAVSEGERMIAETDEVLKSLMAQSAAEEDYLTAVRETFGADKITASFPVGTYQSLFVQLSAVYPARFRIDSFQVFTDESDFLYDEEPLNLPH